MNISYDRAESFSVIAALSKQDIEKIIRERSRTAPVPPAPAETPEEVAREQEREQAMKAREEALKARAEVERQQRAREEAERARDGKRSIARGKRDRGTTYFEPFALVPFQVPPPPVDPLLGGGPWPAAGALGM